MSQFKLQQDVFTQATRIPNCFIEKYMPKAAGEFVKVYIYLLKCIEENRSELSIAKIADALESSEKDVIRALKYWEKKGLLRLTFEDNVLTSLRMISFAEMTDDQEKITLNVSAKGNPAPAKETPAVREEDAPRRTEESSRKKEAEAAPAYTKKQYSPEEIASFSNQDEIRVLQFAIERYLGKPLSGSDFNKVLFFYNELQLPTDVIDYLFDYCVSKGHKNMRYIEKTAIEWANQDIRSLSAAKKRNGIYSDYCYPVLRAFGLSGRNPSKGEADYVSKWSLSYGFTLEMILEACNRTMNAIHQPSFEYTDSILTRWKAAGISTPEELQALDEQREKEIAKGTKKSPKKKEGSNKFHNFEQRDYDFDELEKKLFKV